MTLTFYYREDDSQWPTKNVVGSQEIEVRLGNEHISFEVKNKEYTSSPINCLGPNYYIFRLPN